MNRRTIENILVGHPITQESLNTFITEYTLEVLKRDISAQELSGISQAIQARVFNLRYAAIQAARLSGLTVLSVFDVNNNLIKTTIY